MRRIRPKSEMISSFYMILLMTLTMSDVAD